ncbi:MAG: formylglycine-generating enzyme family protein [Candidatus Coatesbacteria bacterium]|nr:formylglycine-generating enzyme family protein [Candidatus Coatesbacteria bacterium]
MERAEPLKSTSIQILSLALILLIPISAISEKIYVDTHWRGGPEGPSVTPAAVKMRLAGPDEISPDSAFDLSLEVIPESSEGGAIWIKPGMTALVIFDDAKVSIPYLPVQEAFYDGEFHEMPLTEFWNASDVHSLLRTDELLYLQDCFERFTATGSFLWRRYTRPNSESYKRYDAVHFIEKYDSVTLPFAATPSGSNVQALRYKIPVSISDLDSPIYIIFTEFGLSNGECNWSFPFIAVVFNPGIPISGRPEAPTLTKPETNPHNPDRPVRFEWTQVDDVSRYTFWCTSAGYQYMYELGQTPFWVIDHPYWADIPNGRYFWWATAENDNSQSEQSDVWTFTKEGRGDENCPILLGPEHGVINPDRPFDLTWSEIPGCNSYDLRFRLPGTNDHQYMTISGNSFTVDESMWAMLPEGAVFWQVKPSDASFGATYADGRSFIKHPASHSNEMEMVPIPGGTFEMGSPDDEWGHQSQEGPVHTVTVSSFEISRTSITRKQWLDVMGWIDYPDRRYPEHQPIHSITWFDAVSFCNMLSQAHGLEECYTLSDIEYDSYSGLHITWAEVTCEWEADGYRLPTNAEWEYACRAGTTTRFYIGDSVFDMDRAGWYLCNSGMEMHPVGECEPNAYDLYDMLGNTWEWVWDWMKFGYYAESPSVDPHGPETGLYSDYNKVMRGGVFLRRARNCRSASRWWKRASLRYTNSFRVVRATR